MQNLQLYRKHPTTKHIKLSNFVSAASADSITITSLTKTISDLSTEFSKANAAIAALTKKIDNGQNSNNAGSNGHAKKKCKSKKLATDIHGVKREFKHTDNAFKDPMSYCWTHRFRCQTGNNSTTCDTKMTDISTLLRAQTHKAEVSQRKLEVTHW